MIFDKEQYEGLGRLLTAAGVNPAKSEAMVARILAVETASIRDQIVQQVHVQVGDEIDRLEFRHKDVLIDVRQMIGTLRGDLDVYRRVWRHNHTIIRRIGILILAMQLVLAGMLVVALSGWWHQASCNLQKGAVVPAELSGQNRTAHG